MKSSKRDPRDDDSGKQPAAAAGARRRPPTPQRKAVPSWLITVAVIVTVVVTVWIITKKNPGLWEQETAAAPLRIVHATSPALAVTEQLQMVAGARPIPPIQAGAANPHADLGPCATCHTVLGSTGAPIPALHAYATMPHTYPGGLCSDCHATLPPPATATGAAGQLVAAAGGQAAAKVTEAEWMGMEVAPLTAITRDQYGIPNGINGVVVTEVEGRARDAKLAAGDVIIAVDSKPINSPADFAAATGNGRADRGSLQVFRGGKVLQAAFQPAAAAAPPPVQPPAAGGDVPAQPIYVPAPAQTAPQLAPPAAAMTQPQPMVPPAPLQPMVPPQLAPPAAAIPGSPVIVQPPGEAVPGARPEVEGARRQF